MEIIVYISPVTVRHLCCPIPNQLLRKDNLLSVIYLERKPHQVFHAGPQSWLNLNLEMLLFVEAAEEIWRVWRKTLSVRREPTTNSTYLIWHWDWNWAPVTFIWLQACDQSLQVFNQLNWQQIFWSNINSVMLYIKLIILYDCMMYNHTDPSNIIIVEDRYLERGTFVHWLHLYIAPFVTACSTLNIAGINLTYLL